jgi:hypothetical protein
VHEAAAEAEYCPAAQLVHRAPAWEYFPPAQLVQSPAAVPSTDDCPAVQAMQVLAPPAEYRPAPQSVHESAAGAECWPARHVEQSPAPAREYVPPPQLVHWLSEVAPVDA